MCRDSILCYPSREGQGPALAFNNEKKYHQLFYVFLVAADLPRRSNLRKIFLKVHINMI